LQDFCNTAKTVQLNNRQKFFHQLASNGILQELPPFLTDPEYTIRMAVTEILVNILEYEPSLLRSFILAQTKHGARPLTELLIERLVEEQELGMQMQFVEILRLLLDIARPDCSGSISISGVSGGSGKDESTSAAYAESTNFLHFFYNENFSLLVKPLRQLDSSSKLDDAKATLINHLLELLCFFIRTHTNRIKYYILGDDLLNRICTLFASGRDVTLRLTAVRLMRTLIGQKDEFFNRFIIKQNLLAPLMRMFDRNGSRYNLLNSMCLELFEFIRAVSV
jgi:protein phosphatase-4 regulatory subunit 3